MGSEREAMWISLAVEDEVEQLRALLREIQRVAPRGGIVDHLITKFGLGGSDG